MNIFSAYLREKGHLQEYINYPITSLLRIITKDIYNLKND